jgi:hypothetical protein
VPSATSWEASLAKVKRMRKTNLGEFGEVQELDEFREVGERLQPDAWGPKRRHCWNWPSSRAD